MGGKSSCLYHEKDKMTVRWNTIEPLLLHTVTSGSAVVITKHDLLQAAFPHIHIEEVNVCFPCHLTENKKYWSCFATKNDNIEHFLPLFLPFVHLHYCYLWCIVDIWFYSIVYKIKQVPSTKELVEFKSIQIYPYVWWQSFLFNKQMFSTSVTDINLQ